MSLNWQLLKFPPLADMKQAREACHQAIQNVSAIGRSFLPKSEDDSPSSLEWDHKLQRLVGRWIETEELTFRSSLDLGSFEVYLVNDQLATLSSMSMIDVKQKDVMIWLENEMKSLGLDFSKLDLNLPYIIPEYNTAKGKPFIINNPIALKELSALYNNTSLVLNNLLSDESGITEIKCWPHHFDIAGKIVQLDTGDPSTSKSIGLGMSPGDKYYEEPYFYVTPWPYVIQELPDIANTLGHWHQDDWVGAVLPISKIKSYDLIQDQRGLVRRFFNETLSILKKYVK